MVQRLSARVRPDCNYHVFATAANTENSLQIGNVTATQRAASFCPSTFNTDLFEISAVHRWELGSLIDRHRRHDYHHHHYHHRCFGDNGAQNGGDCQGRSDGGYIGIYTPKSVYLKKFLCGCLVSLQWLVNIYIHPNQIPGYASGDCAFSHRCYR